jgi:hypothetical protein
LPFSANELAASPAEAVLITEKRIEFERAALSMLTRERVKNSKTHRAILSNALRNCLPQAMGKHTIRRFIEQIVDSERGAFIHQLLEDDKVSEKNKIFLKILLSESPGHAGKQSAGM